MLFRNKLKINSYPKRSYFTRLVLTYIFLIMIPIILVSMVIYYNSSGIIEEEVGKSVDDMLKQTSNIINGIYFETRDIFIQALQNKIATEIIGNTDSHFNSYEVISRTKDLIDSYQKIVGSNNYIESIYMYINNYKVVVTSDKGAIPVNEVGYKDWINDDIEKGKDIDMIFRKEKDLFKVNPDRYYYSFRGKFYTLLKKKDNMLLLNLNIDAINERISQLKIRESGYVVVTDENGRILFHKNKDLWLSDLGNLCRKGLILQNVKGNYIDMVDGKKTMVIYTTVDGLGWKVIAFVPLYEITSKMDIIKNVAIVITLVTIIVSILFSLAALKSIYKPLELMVTTMKRVEMGNMNARIEGNRTDEFGYLYETFNNMIEKINQLVIDTYKLKLLNTESELKALQAQINPHFLHNTLNSIYCMAKACKMNSLSDMIRKLSDYLRLGFGTGGSETIIKEELEHVMCYVDIQMIRYIGRIDFSYDLDPDLMQYIMPRFIMQPLIENSINHGMKEKEEKLQISIKGRQVGEDILLEIKDNGTGIQEERLEIIRESLKNGNNEGDSFALCNINSRIKLLYGEKYGLCIDSRLDSGISLTILIPARKWR